MRVPTLPFRSIEPDGAVNVTWDNGYKDSIDNNRFTIATAALPIASSRHRK